ncbi:MAG: DUF945 family protein [Gammaproteobacteria bacterium]|nr:DUF945 family protein [Gammaproteobacteria bacterium]
MKRVAIAAVVLVVVLAAALPPLFGARARSLMESDLAYLADLLAPYGTVEVSLDDWDLGWFSSTATARVVVAFDDRPDVPPRLVDLPAFSRTFPNSITLRHGPVVTGPAAGLGWGSVELVIDASLVPALQAFHDATGLDRIAHLGISIGFLGNATFGLDIPAFVYEVQEQQFDFRGLEADATVDVAGEAVAFGGEFGGLGVTSQASQLVAVGTTTWSGRSRADPRYPNLWLGEGEVGIARAMASGGQAGEMVEVSDIRLRGESVVEGDRYVATGLYRAKEMQVMNAQLDDLVLDYAMGYGAEGMVRLMAGGLDVDSLTPEVQLEIGDALLRQRFTFDIERLGFEHEGRPASAAVAMAYRGDELPDDFNVELPLDFMALLPLLSVNLDLAFHRELLGDLGIGQMDGVVRMLASEGIVQESGDDYTLNVGFANGGLTVNGDPFEPFQLMGLLGGP